jgi:hypothetical protein
MVEKLNRMYVLYLPCVPVRTSSQPSILRHALFLALTSLERIHDAHLGNTGT